MTQTGSGADKPARIVITHDDLDASPPSFTAPANPAPFGSVGPPLPALGIQPAPLPVAVGRGSFLTTIGKNTIVSGIVAGAIGGLLGFFLAENIKNPSKIVATSASDLRVQSGLWTLVFGLGLGFVLMSWEGFTSGSPQKALRDGALGALIGAGAGFVGGYIAQWLFSKFLESMRDEVLNGNVNSVKNKLLIARAVGWAVLGGLLGAGVGIRGGPKKILNGFIGGLIGGAVGGLIFQLFDNSSTSTSGFVPRLIGLTATGIGIGLGVGLVERLRRDAWIMITGGPMTGKEFILYNSETRLGRDYRCDIVLAKDASIAPFHAAFQKSASGAVTVVAAAGVPVTVNGVPVSSGMLRDRDVVGVGASHLTFQERSVRQ